MPHVVHLENGRLGADSPRETVAEIARLARAHRGPGSVVVHFHGGLVDRRQGRAIATRLDPVYRSAGAFPVFFTWEAGLLETLRNNLEEIGREHLFRTLWRKTTALTAPRCGGPGQEPCIDALLAGETVAEPDVPHPQVAPLSDRERRAVEETLREDRELTAEIARARGPDEVPPMIRGVVGIVGNIVDRFALGRDHGFHATVVEEILRGFYLARAGEFVWNLMKRESADAFAPDPRVHGGTAFLYALARREDRRPPPPVALVGHSAGTLHVTEFVERAAGVFGEGPEFDLILLAPALTFARTREFLERRGSRIRRLSLFGMSDELERRDAAVPVLYPRSLLYLVSGVLEGGPDVPILGMQRFHDRARFPDADHETPAAVRGWLERAGAELTWSVSDRSASRRHVDFDEDPATLATIRRSLAR